MNLGDGIYVDGSWELSVLVEDLQITKRIRVTGETHVGGLMLKLVELIDLKLDWSDHALWWPSSNCWLLKTRHTLDQCGLQANAQLQFQRIHGVARIQLPDLQERELRVSFASSLFSVAVALCKDLGIRHPEELSLRRQDPLLVQKQRQQQQQQQQRSSILFPFNSLRKSRSHNGALSSGGSGTNKNRRSHQFNPLVPKESLDKDGVADEVASLSAPLSVNSLAFEGAEKSSLANSPHVPAAVAFGERGLMRTRTLGERAASSAMWLDSSKSLMEQGFRPGQHDDLLLLRFKFCAFYDLNIKYDSIRINQIFEQAKWTLLSEEVDCTDEEAFLLAALQLQVQLQARSAAQEGTGGLPDPSDEAAADDEIDAALADLEMTLLADTVPSNPKLRKPLLPQQQQQHQLRSQSSDMLADPELAGSLKFFRPRRFSLRSYRRYYFVLRDTTLRMFPDEATARRGSGCSIETFQLKNSEATPDLNLTTRKFGIRLFLLARGGHMQEVWLRCDSKEQFADWMSGINLAARGKTLASRSLFANEVKETLSHIELQAPKTQPVLTVESVSPDIQVADFVAPRCLRRQRSRSSLLQQILERHANLRDKDLLQAKLDYIKVWQRLPSHGVSYFLVNYSEATKGHMTFSEFRKQRHQKQEILGVSFNKILRLDPQSGDTLGTLRYHELQSWTVNWEVLSVTLQLNRPPHKMCITPCCSHPAGSRHTLCKTLAEFIGGYVFLSLRKPDRSQTLDEQMFHKLTASRDHT